MIRVDAAQLLRAERLLKDVPKGASKAISSAINRSAEAARTELVRKVRDKYYVKYGSMLRAIRINKSRPDMKLIRATLRVMDTRRALIEFRVSPGRPTTGKRRPAHISVAVKKEGGMKPLPGAFINVGKSSGQSWVMKRAGTARYPVHIKYGPSTSELAGTSDVRKAVEDRAREMLDSRLDHEINRVLEGYNG